MNLYHIHISTKAATNVKGWKKTQIKLEKGDIEQEDIMFTKTVKGTDSVDSDIFKFIANYGKLFNFNRFKVEVINNPGVVDSYSNKTYREIHIKTSIPIAKFKVTKLRLQEFGEIHNFALSNNPKEINTSYITQFINMRFLSGDKQSSDIKIKNILDLLGTVGNCNIIEVKDEVSVFDTNFTMDKWWAH